MKKFGILPILFALSACGHTIMSHKCQMMEDGQYFCLEPDIWQYIVDKSEEFDTKKDVRSIYELAKTEVEANTGICGIGNNETYVDELGNCLKGAVLLWFMAPFCPVIATDITANIQTENERSVWGASDWGVYVDEKQQTIDKDIKILACNGDFESVYSNYLFDASQKQVELRWKKEAEEQNAKINMAIKKYGYDLCVMPNIHEIMANNLTFWKDCMVSTRGRAIRVFQQTDAGTLIMHPSNMVDTIVLVEKHSKISQLVDGQYFNGYFVGTGTYQYVTVSGATKTIQKVRYLGE